ncbi:hypothetical protein N0V95_008950 [Ascochyta clinopodiicola]|nr:hypothetical protein N0V95_008950 [Ascochyta clinopodiicola]
MQTKDDKTEEPSHVEWALPTKLDNKTVDDTDAVTQFAPLISHRHWSQTRTLRVPFHSSPLRSPLYKKKGSPDLEADSDPNKSSHCLVRLFNRIKRRTESPNDSTLPATYHRAAFERAFGTGDEPFAVVASTSSTNPIFTLSQDYQVDVTLQHTPHKQDRAQISFIRRLPPSAPNDGTVPRGYFIVVPPQTKLTINGQTYVNDEPAEREDHDGSKEANSRFYIGPLRQFTVIEILSQPLFFFRTRADLDFVRRTAAKADAVEISGRDKNGDVEEEVVDIAWSTSSTPAQKPVSEPPDLRDQVERSGDDEWTDDSGEAIEDACAYLKHRLWAPWRISFDELIPRVLTSINLRQTASSGFSFAYNGRVFRPKRTLIAALPHHDYHVLLIVRQDDGAETELRVLDPMAWRSRSAERVALVTRVNEFIPRPDVASRTEDQKPIFLLPATWHSCAQRAHPEEASTFTILNAWALAMNLQVNPTFTPTQHGSENFFTRAQWLFDLARRDSLDWKLVLAFFRCSGFIESEELVGDEGSERLPPLDRRFRQGGRSFERAVGEQKEVDDAELTNPKIEDTSCLAVKTGMEKAHSDLLPADEMSDELLNDLPRFVDQGHWQLTETTAHLVERSNYFHRAARSANPATAPKPPEPSGAAPPSSPASNLTKPPAGTTPPAPRPITSQQSRKDKACAFFHRTITAIKAQVHIPDQINVQGPALSSNDVFASINTVARALNRLQRAGEGITVVEQPLDQNGAVRADGNLNALTEGVLLLPWQYEKHTLLVVAQSARSSGGGIPTCHVVDSAPWTLKQVERQQFRDTVTSTFEAHWRPGRAANGVKLPPGMTWVLGPRQLELWQCGYYAVFNAWSVMLDCTLDINFAPRDGFFQRGREVIAVVLAGLADWKLVWSFLLCYGYVKLGELPGEERRFTSSVDGDVEIDQTLRKVAPCGYNFSKRVHAAMQRPHGVVLQNWDGWDKTDVSIRAPALFKTDKFPLTLNTEQLRDAYHELVTQPRQSTADFTSTDKPCVYVKEQLAALLSDEDTCQRLGSLRSEVSASTEAGRWLLNEEVALAIASVTLAITSIQDVRKGFCAVSGTDVQACYRTDQKHRQDIVLQAAPRFGRPMFVPVVEDNHTVLSVVQFNRNDEMTVSILDSKAAHYTRAARIRVFNMVMATAEGMAWWREKFASWKDVPRPSTATWVPCAQQPGDDECGYTAILNSWALALGLELNPHAAPIWDSKAAGTGNLFQTVLDIVHLARIGVVDWTLIYAFLRCHRFVHEGTVPQDRRFTNTVRLRDETELNERLQDFNIQDMEHWSLESSDLNDIKGSNAIHLPDGVEQTSSSGDECAPVLKAVRREKAKKLSALGQLYPEMSSDESLRFYTYFCIATDAKNKSKQTKTTGAQIGVDRANFFLDSLRWQRKAIKKTSPEYLLSLYRDFLSNARSQASSLGRLQKQHCALTGEGLGLLQTLLANTKLDDKLAGGIPDCRFKEHLDLGEVNLAIAAVVEAIDARQASLHSATSTTPFTGGFALSTRNNIQIACYSTSADGAVSRPRRCFLLPMTINDTDIQQEKLTLMGKTTSNVDWSRGNRSHHFLTVVQEESREPTINNPTTRQFCVYTLDTAPRRYREDVVQNLIHKRIRDTATNLGWARQRNEDGAVRFRPQHSQVVVFPQLKGGWQCGLHTILNAWILALGLMPRSEQLVLGADFYEEFWVLVRAAVAGLLDWKTLVAWLFCNNLVTSRSLASVPEDRRFEITRHQDGSATVYQDGGYEFLGEVGLGDRVEGLFMQDLAAVLGTQVPYDHSSNVDFLDADIAGDEAESGSESGSEEDEDEDSEEGLEEKSGPGSGSDSGEESESGEEADSQANAQPESDHDPEEQSSKLSEPSDPLISPPSDPPANPTSEGNAEVDNENETDDLTDRDAEGSTDDEYSDNDDIEPKSLKRTFDDVDINTGLERSRKRVKRFSGDLNFLAAVDVDCDGGGDGDVKMTGSPWRRVEELGFLSAF